MWGYSENLSPLQSWTLFVHISFLARKNCKESLVRNEMLIFNPVKVRQKKDADSEIDKMKGFFNEEKGYLYFA